MKQALDTRATNFAMLCAIFAAMVAFGSNPVVTDDATIRKAGSSDKPALSQLDRNLQPSARTPNPLDPAGPPPADHCRIVASFCRFLRIQPHRSLPVPRLRNGAKRGRAPPASGMA